MRRQRSLARFSVRELRCRSWKPKSAIADVYEASASRCFTDSKIRNHIDVIVTPRIKSCAVIGKDGWDRGCGAAMGGDNSASATSSGEGYHVWAQARVTPPPYALGSWIRGVSTSTRGRTCSKESPKS